MYVVLPSRIEPDFGYIALYRPYQCQAPIQGNPNPTQTGQEVPQASPTMWHVPLGPRHEESFLEWDSSSWALFGLFKGAGQVGRVWGCLGWHSKQLESY